MNLKTVKTLSNNVYTVRVETTLTDAESELVSDFGDPTVSLGGNFYGDTITYTGTIVLNQTITQSSARGQMIKDGTIHRFTTYGFAVGGLDGALATLTAVADVSYTLSASSKRLEADFPATRTLTNEVDGDIYGAEIKKRADLVVVTLRANSDTFSGESVVTL